MSTDNSTEVKKAVDSKKEYTVKKDHRHDGKPLKAGDKITPRDGRQTGFLKDLGVI